MKVWCLIVFFASVYALDKVKTDKTREDRQIMPVFQVVKFPNDPCVVTSGSKNGTCYTADECTSKGGVNAGSCAQGFGVCCTFTLGCGSVTSENCTYFESASTPTAGPCRVKVCKANPNICQIRLDFNTFVITGPATVTTSIGKVLNGILSAAGGQEIAEATRCITDTFSVSNQRTFPQICGTNTGYHAYFEASDQCNSLDFQLGNQALGISSIATRSWSIKIQQYSCDYGNLAPTGCDQYFYGVDGMNHVYSYNYAGSRHIADQKQTICVRREANKCRICWSATAADFELSGDTDFSKGAVKGSICCAHGSKGSGINNGGAYDCVMIPGARSTKSGIKPASVCGGKKGLVTSTSTTTKTICSKNLPFRILFQSDGFEMSKAAKDEATGASKGFKILYFQTACT